MTWVGSGEKEGESFHVCFSAAQCWRGTVAEQGSAWSASVCICVYMCVYVYICVYVCICVYMCAYVCICVYMCVYVCICVYMCVYVCICVYVYNTCHSLFCTGNKNRVKTEYQPGLS